MLFTQQTNTYHWLTHSHTHTHTETHTQGWHCAISVSGLAAAHFVLAFRHDFSSFSEINQMQEQPGRQPGSSRVSLFSGGRLCCFICCCPVSATPPVNTDAPSRGEGAASVCLPALPACLLDIHQAISSID